MNDFAIQVGALSKQYRIGKRREKYRTLRDTLANAFVAPFRRAGRLLKGEATGASELNETIWALKDVSFEIRQGEVVGIIGRNGAGKSTLLKILSRITEPTKGFVEIRGRVGALLEVGTGFHQELTGRDNIYLNGAILGMKRAEIVQGLDEIVAFAEVEKFIDTPVKHYSSGMYLRLAFAVAAHLRPEILIVDEVLAVGDIRFQKKCLNKMKDVGSHGRTVLFVSHNMDAITRLCKRTILLDEGRIVEDGQTSKVLSSYLNSGRGIGAVREWYDLKKAPGGDIARLCAVRILTEDGRTSVVVDIRQPVMVEMEYEVLKPGHKLLPSFEFNNEKGAHAFSTLDIDPAWRGRARPAGRYVSTVHIPGNLFSEGSMFITPCLQAIEPYIFQFYEKDMIGFQVVDSLDGDSARGDYAGNMGGVVRPLLKWTTRYEANMEKVGG